MADNDLGPMSLSNLQQHLDAAGLPSRGNSWAQDLQKAGASIESYLPATYIPAPDPSPARTEANTRRAADQAEITAQQLIELTEAMRESVRLSAETRADAAASAQSAASSALHAKITGYGSLGLSLVAIALAIFIH